MTRETRRIEQPDHYFELILQSMTSTLPLLAITSILGWVAWGLSIWCAALGCRDLSARGVSRPFHWAWAILSPLVFVIGRHVVISRRGGMGAAPSS